MRRLPQSTAYTVVFKLFLSSDHVSAATGKTVAITLSKAGAAFGNPNAGASNATEISGGWYKFALDTTDTGTLGDLVLVGTAAACDTADIPMQVVSATTNGATNLDATVSSRASPTNITAGTITTVTNLTNAATAGDLTATMKASVNAEADTALADYDAPTSAEMVAAFTQIKGATWAATDTLEAIRDRGDAAWTTAVGFSTHSATDVWAVAARVLTANTNLNDPTAAAVADAVWDEVLAGHVGVGSAGEALAAAGTAGDPWTTALPGAYGAGTAGFIIGTNINATTSSRATPAQVNAEVLDVMNVDTHAEPGQNAPGATISWGLKIDYIYKSWRNEKRGDATGLDLYNDAGTVVDQTSAVSDVAGVVTRGKVGSGP